MNILQIAPYYPPYPGGQEKYIQNLCNYLCSKGNKVTLLTSNYPVDKSHDEIHENNQGFQIYKYKCYARLLRNPFAPGILTKGIKLKSYDLIHAHNLYSLTTVFAAIIQLKSKKPLIITSHGLLSFDNRLIDLFIKVYTKTIVKFISHVAHVITVATVSEKNDLLNKLKIKNEKIRIIPIGIDLTRWKEFRNNNIENFMKKFSIEKKQIILTATQLIKRKGIAYLIKAMQTIISKKPNTICIIAGCGDEKKRIMNLTKRLNLGDSVIFTYFEREKDLADAYQAADIFVLPSLSEGQPTCILEAWAFNLPVVSTKISGIVDYYSESSILVKPRDSKELAFSILNLLDDPTKVQSLGSSGRKLLANSFNFNIIGNKLIRLYDEIIHLTKY